MRFLLLHYFDESELDYSAGSSKTEPDAEERELDAWVTEMEATGVKLYGGRLRPARDAVTLRIRAGERMLTDGPFAETKEQIAGFDVLECGSLAQAIEVASRHPTARSGTFEVRPFWD
jgi:hypothetical protein